MAKFFPSTSGMNSEQINAVTEMTMQLTALESSKYKHDSMSLN